MPTQKTRQEDLVEGRAFPRRDRRSRGTGAERRRDFLNLFASYIRNLVASISPDGKPRPELPWSAYIGVAYAIRQLAVDALDKEPEPDLIALEEDVAIWLSDLFRERESARSGAHLLPDPHVARRDVSGPRYVSRYHH